VNAATKAKSVFFFHMAQPILKTKAMPGLPGNPKAPSQSGTEVDLKKALLPVTSFIRLYAIRENLDLNNSIERAEALAEKKIISDTTREDLEASYDFLSFLRIKGQVYSISRHEAPGNTIQLGQLTPNEALILKKVNSDISSLQTLLGSVYSRAE
jgi:CBS domain-containing protein